MQLLAFRQNGRAGVAVRDSADGFHGLTENDRSFPGSIDRLLQMGGADRDAAVRALRSGGPIDIDTVEVLPPLQNPGKILCAGLNYRDHANESGMQAPDFPALFVRFASSLIGHGAPLIRPIDSEKLDYEGELVAVIGKGGRRIPKAEALDHVAGYSIFNDGSVRDFQLRTSQWTVGKNFDGTGGFGPVLVTADELPPGARGLTIETRLNGEVVQHASTDDLIFDVATLVASISQAITLAPGDLIVTGTPSGVGAARKPPRFMKPGDVCEVEIERIGVLRNTVADESELAGAKVA